MTTSPAPSRSWWGGLFVVAVLVGLLGMHALSGAPDTTHAAVTVAHQIAGHDGTADAGAQAGEESGHAAASAGEPVADHHAIAGACLAALCLAVLLLIAVALHGRPGDGWVLRRRRVVRARRVSTYLPAPGPPPAWRFSVIRC